jgi:hypothetical protein
MEVIELLIASLEREKAEIEDKINDLNKQLKHIDQLIIKHKSEHYANFTNERLSKKNIDRIYFERLIVEAIKKSSVGMSTLDLRLHFKKKLIQLNYSTLRSYLSRMRDREIIRTKARTNLWIMNDNTNNN